MILTKEIAYKEIRDFFPSNPTPLVIFGTGMSCAVDIEFGMNKLNSELQSKIPKRIIGQTELEKEWGKVVDSLNAGVDLESSLNHIQSDSLIKFVVEITSNLITQLDRKYSFEILNGTKQWPATEFFKRLVNGLPEGDRKLQVITPNYDLLAEYAFENAGIRYINGFSGCLVKKIDWVHARNSISNQEKTVINRKPKKKTIEIKHIELHKVHGSLNVFYYNQQVVEANSWIYDPPDNVERVIITPGISKYQKISNLRLELFQNADNAVNNKNSFIFIGYGFNDQHIENYVLQKLIVQKCNCLIITRDSNKRIEEILDKSNNLWLICKQELNDFTRIKNKNYDDWLYLNDTKIWDISEFTKKIIIGD
ncbi:MAG: SIR2 family protein [Ignavibacteriaceae bacterium]